MDFWRNPEVQISDALDAPASDAARYSDRYWIMVIFGRMLGTSEEARKELIKIGVVDLIAQGAKDVDKEVRACAVKAVKGLVKFEEGRKVIDFEMLIRLLGK